MYQSLLAALQFILAWPALRRAAGLLIQRLGEIDGHRYEYLSSVTAALSDRHPLAATLALRAMIDFTLTYARSKRYGYAAEHLAQDEKALMFQIAYHGLVGDLFTVLAELERGAFGRGFGWIGMRRLRRNTK